MTIIVKVVTGQEWGTTGSLSIEEKVFTSLVDLNKFLTMMESFDAMSEIESIQFDCQLNAHSNA